MTAQRLYSVLDAADYLDIKPHHVLARVDTGKLRIARVEHATPGRPEQLWFTGEALEESQALMDKRRPAVRTDQRTSSALAGAYRGPAMSDTQNAANYATWVQRRRTRLQGGAELTF